MGKSADTKQSRISRLIVRATDLWNYFDTGIWSDTRRNWWLNILRTLNLSIKSSSTATYRPRHAQ